MSAEERRAKARERVKAWKEVHPKSVFWQRQRRYARMKAKKKEERGGVKIELELREKVAPREVQETYLEHPALSEGDPEVVREHARAIARRKGVGVPEGLMEPEQKELRRNDGRRVGSVAGAGDRAGGAVAHEPDHRRGTGDVSEEDDRVSGRESAAQGGTDTVTGVQEWLARKRAVLAGSGVEVELELP